MLWYAYGFFAKHNSKSTKLAQDYQPGQVVNTIIAVIYELLLPKMSSSGLPAGAISEYDNCGNLRITTSKNVDHVLFSNNDMH